MNSNASSCEVASTATEKRAGSRILRWRPDFRWEGTAVTDYKAPADHWCSITRCVLVGESGENTGFHLRYFEIAPGGRSSLEHHKHAHAVVVLRGRGLVRLRDQEHAVGFGDTVYVAPEELHQFRNDGEEPFGFLCVVDAGRDIGRVVCEGTP
jgi:ribulose-bisphosphate carboxylase large chain